MDIGNNTTGLIVGIDGRGAVSGAKQVNDALGSMGKKAEETNTALGTLTKSFALLGGAAAIHSAVEHALEFSNAMTKVSIMLDGSSEKTEYFAHQMEDLAKQFGTSGAQQARSLFDIMQHGAERGADAVAKLAAANTLAKVSGESLESSVGILGQVMDAFKGRIESNQQAVDVLFTAMKNGGGTVSEIGQVMRMIAPQANALGVSFQELAAFTAAAGQSGLSSRQALLALRDVLGSVANVTPEVRNNAKLLGIDFSEAGLRAKGFSKFMQDLVTATRGNAQNLQLFGISASNLVPILVAAGGKGSDMEKMLKAIGLSAGEAQKALEVFNASPGAQLERLKANLESISVMFGTQILNAAGPALTWINTHMEELAKWLEVIGAAALPGGALVAVVAIFEKLLGILKLIAVAAAANPIIALISAISAGVAYVALFGDQIKVSADGLVTLQAVGIAAWKNIKDAFTAAFEYISDKWQGFVDLINEGIDKVNALAKALGKEGNLVDRIGGASAESAKETGKSIGSSMVDGMREAFEGSDLMKRARQEQSKITAASLANAANGPKQSAATTVSTLAGANDNTGKAGPLIDTTYANAIKTINQQIADENRLIGLNSDARADLTSVMAIEQQMREKGIDVTKDQEQHLLQLTARLRQLKDQVENDPFAQWNDSLQRIDRTMKTGIIDGMKQAGDQLADFAMKGSMDLSSLGNIVSNLAKQFISLQIQKQFLSPLFGAAQAGLGSFASSLFAANGAAFDGGSVVPMANGGLISSPTLFKMANGGTAVGGEAGTEAVMPLRRLTNGRLGIEATGGGGGVFAPSINIVVNGGGDARNIASVVRQEVQAQMGESMKQFASGGSKGMNSQQFKQQVDMVNSELMSNPNSKTSQSLNRNTSTRTILR